MVQGATQPFSNLLSFLRAQVLTAPTESHTPHFTNSRYVMLNRKIKVIWPFLIYENDHFVWFSLASRLGYMYVFGEHGSLSNINLRKELDFLKAKSHVERTKLQQLRKDFDLYKLYGIGRDRDYKDSCRSDRCATCLYGQCKPNKPCRSSGHQLLDHWWPSICFFIIWFPSHTPKEGDGRKRY